MLIHFQILLLKFLHARGFQYSHLRLEKPSLSIQGRKKDGRIMAKDPVCGMMVDEKKAKFVSEHEGKSSTSAPRVAKYIRQGPTQVRSSKVKRSLGTTAYSSVPVAPE